MWWQGCEVPGHIVSTTLRKQSGGPCSQVGHTVSTTLRKQSEGSCSQVGHTMSTTLREQSEGSCSQVDHTVSTTPRKQSEGPCSWVGFLSFIQSEIQSKMCCLLSGIHLTHSRNSSPMCPDICFHRDSKSLTLNNQDSPSLIVTPKVI